MLLPYLPNFIALTGQGLVLYEQCDLPQNSILLECWIRRLTTDALTTWAAHFSFAHLRPLHRLVGDSDRLNLDQRFGGVEGRDLDDCVGPDTEA